MSTLFGRTVDFHAAALRRDKLKADLRSHPHAINPVEAQRPGVIVQGQLSENPSVNEVERIRSQSV